VESGEGIERHIVHDRLLLGIEDPWNPVKELKAVRYRCLQRCLSLAVESGEGIERDTGPSGGYLDSKTCGIR